MKHCLVPILCQSILVGSLLSWTRDPRFVLFSTSFTLNDSHFAFLHFVFYYATLNSTIMLPQSGFEPWSTSVGSKQPANCATFTANKSLILISFLGGRGYGQYRWSQMSLKIICLAITSALLPRLIEGKEWPLSSKTCMWVKLDEVTFHDYINKSNRPLIN